MDALLRRRTMIAEGGNPTPRLPEGYTELAYVATDSDAWVDTGISGSTTLEVYVKFMVTTYTQYGVIYGNYLDSSHKNNRVMLNSTTQLSVSGGNNQGGAVNGFTMNSIQNLTVTSNSATLNGTTTAISASSQTANTTKICLGNRGTTTYISRDIGLRIYSFIVKDNGTKVIEYVPAKRDADGDIGFYDLINEVFVKSLTGTDFSSGPNA